MTSEGERVRRVREQIDSAPIGAWFRPGALGGNDAEQALSRLARDPSSQLIRAAKGLYQKCAQPDAILGKTPPRPVDVALQVASGRGVGPAGVSAIAHLGLTTQVPPWTSLCVVGQPPVGIRGVEWEARSNPARAQLRYSEVAVVEMLALFPAIVEVDWGTVVRTVARLADAGQVDVHRIAGVVAVERRKPALRENMSRLLFDLDRLAGDG